MAAELTQELVRRALDNGVEEAVFKKKIPQMLEEAKLKKQNKEIAKELGIDWL